ncbi:MAG: ribonuclease J [Firmicutes bacterium]|nr:ribonuclease J [Bacillota bacterium]
MGEKSKKGGQQEQGNKKNTPNVKVVFLGGVGEIGKNMTAIECGDNIIVIDAGSCFPNQEEMPGIDYIIPDFNYLQQNAKRVKGIIVTHGHEDHIGAIPYVLKEVNTPVYGSNLAIALIQHKITEHKLEGIKLKVVEEREVVTLGCFSVEFVRVTHSIAGAFAVAVTTPKGVIFHTGDFKIDHTPVDGRCVDFSRIAQIGENGVLLLLQESTNVEIDGYSMSERNVGKSLDNIFGQNIHKRLIVATFASNVHRIQQILNCALKYNRRVAFSGRSMENIVKITYAIKELKYPPNLLIDLDKIGSIPNDRVCILATGSQGEPESALSRMSTNEFKKVVIGKDDTVIIAASPIPGNQRSIYKVINNLSRKGADVIYHALTSIHVSGHACREELKMMMSLTKPKFFMPVHGEYRHLKLHAELASLMGISPANVEIPELGQVYDISKSGIKKQGTVPSGIVMLDSSLQESSEVLLRDRKLMSGDGFVIAIVNASSKSGELTAPPIIISRGIMLPESLVEDIKTELSVKFMANAGSEFVASEARNDIRKVCAKILFNKLKRRPMVIPITIES